MKDIIKEILNEKKSPDYLKESILESAKAYLLLKDIGDLFGSSIPKASGDIIVTISDKKNNKKDESK